MADEEQNTGVGVFLIPEASDPIVQASSEQAHMTTVWLGDMNNLDESTIATIRDEIAAYVSDLDGPVVVPTLEQGILGADEAAVQFLEPTEALLALREGLLAASPTVSAVMNSVEQYPQWTPHVTLGYPETPAAGEYDGDAVTFDRVGLWVGPDQEEFPMSGKSDDLDQIRQRAAALRAAAVATEPPTVGETPVIDEMPVDELEDGEELVTEIPVHGVATVEGVPTGDGRGFRPGAIKFGPLPQPLGYEFESGHGSDNSRVSIIGRIDSYERKDLGDGTVEIRWRGVIMPGKPYGALAIESIIDGSYTGLSVIVDSVTVDVEEERAAMRQRLTTQTEALDNGEVPSDDEIEAMLDEYIGDGTTPTTWFSDAQVRRFDMVPTGAFQQGYTALGHEFDDELTTEQLAAAAAALEDCGCASEMSMEDLIDLSVGGKFVVEFSDGHGTSLFGPFDTREEADAWVGSMGEGEYQPMPVNQALTAAATTTFAPGTKDGPGWITHPIPTARIRRYWVRGKGAEKIRWGVPGDFNRCRAQLAKYVQNPDWLAGLCANMHHEALGVWPGQEAGGRHSLAASATAAPLFVLASATVVEEHQVYPAELFAEPTEDHAFGLRIDRETGRVWGYAADWSSCHIGISGACQRAPHSSSDYAFFRKGVVDTDQGEQRVGLITEGIGHAGDRMSAAAATAHYDQTDAVRAYINIGENSKGIWYSGVLVPGITDAQIDAMRAIGRVSGDWRNWSGVRGDLEMVGLVVVNTEGFQLAASGGVIGIGSLPREEPTELVASGVVLEPGAIQVTAELDAIEFDMDELADKVADKIIVKQERAALAAATAPARAALSARLLSTARAQLAQIVKE